MLQSGALSLFISRQSSYRCYLACVTLGLLIAQLRGATWSPTLFCERLRLCAIFELLPHAQPLVFQADAGQCVTPERRLYNGCEAEKRLDCNLCYLITGRGSTSDRVTCHFAKMASAVLQVENDCRLPESCFLLLNNQWGRTQHARRRSVKNGPFLI